LDRGRVWEDYLDRVNRTIRSFANINQICEDTIKSMILIYSEIFEMVKTSWGKRKLPNHEVFVSVYYQRNIVYLQSSHLLTCIGFIDPSSNLNRTVYETLQRGYLFIVEPQEAEEYFQVIKTEKEESYRSRKGLKYIRKKLYMTNTEEEHKSLYSQLCISAHADIKGAARDYPKYLPKRIEDNLSTILCLMYGNIQMMSECFFDFLNPKARRIIKSSMKRIATTLGNVPLFEPDVDCYSSKVKLKRGNFLRVL
jgi:hypothetical protein